MLFSFKGNQLKPCILAFECFKALVPRVTATSLHSPTHLKLIYYSVGSLAFDKLTDTREPIRSAALDTIVELYVAIQESYESGGKDKYNAQGQLLNEFHKEILGHFECKAPKAREMMMDWARRILQLSYFPFDLILPSLIKSLQDANESVRAKCKETLLELYTKIPNQRQNVLLELKNQTIRSSILDPFMGMLNDIDVKCPYDGPFDGKSPKSQRQSRCKSPPPLKKAPLHIKSPSFHSKQESKTSFHTNTSTSSLYVSLL